MKLRCRHGHELTAETTFERGRIGRRPYRECQICRQLTRIRYRHKKIAAGRWWEIQTTRCLSENELKLLARRLAHGGTICEVAKGTKTYYQTQFYYRWIAWKFVQPLVARRFLKLSNQSRLEKVAATRIRSLTSAPALVGAPNNLTEMVEAALPADAFPELLAEMRQQMILAVLEGQCAYDSASLAQHARRLRGKYFREYANPWGPKSLDEHGPFDERPLSERVSNGLWE